MNTNDGGPAFPRNGKLKRCADADGLPVTHVMEFHNGMSLRDWFAGQALAGMSEYAMGRLDYTEALESVVAMSYRLADAMIAERAKAK